MGAEARDERAAPPEKATPRRRQRPGTPTQENPAPTGHAPSTKEPGTEEDETGETSWEDAAELRLAIGRAARRLRQENEDLTPSMISMLSSIEKEGSVTTSELARIEGLKPPTVTRITTRLEEAGYTKRTPGTDRRSHQIQLTPEGAEALAQIRARRDAHIHTRLQALTPEERAKVPELTDLLRRLL